MPPLGEFFIKSGLRLPMTSRINFAQMEKGNVSGWVWLLVKSAKYVSSFCSVTGLGAGAAGDGIAPAAMSAA